MCLLILFWNVVNQLCFRFACLTEKERGVFKKHSQYVTVLEKIGDDIYVANVPNVHKPRGLINYDFFIYIKIAIQTWDEEKNIFLK